MKKHTERGFTLMELMVVIVIVAILAAVAVPLYINYVRDAQRTEAHGAIGAIISGEQSFFQRSALDGNSHYAANLAELETSGNVDIREAKNNWTFVVDPITSDTDPGFTVLATNVKDPTLKVKYTFHRNEGGTFDDNPTDA